MNIHRNHLDPAQPFAPGAEAGQEDGFRPELKVGAWIAGLFFVGVLGSAAMIPLDAGAHANGIVVVSGNRQAVQHREGGIVSNLFVTEGQSVAKGAPLLRISATEVIAAERGLAGEVLALKALRARLLAERDGRRFIAEPADFLTLGSEDRAIALEALEGQRRVFTARRGSLAAQRGVLSQRIGQHRQQISGVMAQDRSNELQQKLMKDEIDGLRTMVPKGYVSINRLRAMERSAAELTGQHGAYLADVARSREAIGETQMEMASLDERMMEEVTTALRDAEVRLADLEPKLAATREQLARTIVRAPASGRVVNLQVFTVGGVVGAGQTLMEIVPQDRKLVIEGRVSATDGDDLAVGMGTQVRFPAMHDRSAPTIRGRISRVSADSLEDEHSGQRYYKLQVVVPPGELAKLQRDGRPTALKAGLPADVIVPLRKRTALTYLLEPLRQSVWKAGREQ